MCVFLSQAQSLNLDVLGLPVNASFDINLGDLECERPTADGKSGSYPLSRVVDVTLVDKDGREVHLERFAVFFGCGLFLFLLVFIWGLYFWVLFCVFVKGEVGVAFPDCFLFLRFCVCFCGLIVSFSASYVPLFSLLQDQHTSRTG